MMSSVVSVVSRLWAPAGLFAASTVAVGFAINFLTAGKAGWWWLVLAAGAPGLIVSAVWTYFAEKMRGDESPSASTQQTASGRGTNISITADNGSAAAWQMGTVNLGRPRKK
jgi:hypothetical protein